MALSAVLMRSSMLAALSWGKRARPMLTVILRPGDMDEKSCSATRRLNLSAASLERAESVLNRHIMNSSPPNLASTHLLCEAICVLLKEEPGLAEHVPAEGYVYRHDERAAPHSLQEGRVCAAHLVAVYVSE